MALKKQDANHPYSDIIELPHHQSSSRKHMAASDRAAQFSSFAALVGYGDAISETERMTEEKTELDEEMKTILDNRLQILLANLSDCPEVTVLYFVPDAKKTGGKYVSLSGSLKNIDTHKRRIHIADDIRIPIDHILDIDSELFNDFE